MPVLHGSRGGEVSIGNFLTCSIDHIPTEFRHHLFYSPLSEWPVAGLKGPYGYFIYAHDEDGNGWNERIPPELMAIFAYARQHACEYVYFESNADPLKHFPIFQLHDYAFEIKLNAVARVEAPSREAAIAAMKKVISCLDPIELETNEMLLKEGIISLTQASLYYDEDETFAPFETDGEPSPGYIARLLREGRERGEGKN